MDKQKLPFATDYTPTPPAESAAFPTGKKELRLWWAMLILASLWSDFAFYGGFALGCGLATVGIITAAWIYLKRSGRSFTPYATSLLLLSLVLAASFFRSNDGFVKFVSFCFLLISVPLALILSAGKNRRNPKGLTSLLDAPRALLVLGIGRLPESLRGLRRAGKAMGRGGKNRRAVLAGLAVAVPLVAILVALLASADAAFDGLLMLIPEVDLGEPIGVLLLALILAPVLYAVCAGLQHDTSVPQPPRERKGLNPLTVNTVLVAICAVYLLYLGSQLAYFVGGLSGLLPEEYTLAQYARRGFFEMAILCLLNLSFMAAAVGLADKTDGRAPLFTRILSLFVGIVTLFFVISASAKMFLYISSYGLTRLRVLTEVIMVFLALATVFVSIWLFLPKFAYMKAILLTALAMCSITAWADVDTVIANYNVWAYRAGITASVDTYHLARLSQGAIPALEKLAQDQNEDIANAARAALERAAAHLDGPDIRALTLSELAARPILKTYKAPEAAEDTVYQPNYDDRIDFGTYYADFQFAADKILTLTSHDGQWRQLIYVEYSTGPVLEDIRSGTQFPCDGELAAAMDRVSAAFPWHTAFHAVVVYNGEVHFCDSSDKIALVYSPETDPTWLSDPFSSDYVAVEGLGGSWYHVTL